MLWNYFKFNNNTNYANKNNIPIRLIQRLINENQLQVESTLYTIPYSNIFLNLRKALRAA